MDLRTSKHRFREARKRCIFSQNHLKKCVFLIKSSKKVNFHHCKYGRIVERKGKLFRKNMKIISFSPLITCTTFPKKCVFLIKISKKVNFHDCKCWWIFERKVTFFEKISKNISFSPLIICTTFCEKCVFSITFLKKANFHDWKYEWIFVQKWLFFLLKKKVTHIIHIWEEWWKPKKNMFLCFTIRLLNLKIKISPTFEEGGEIPAQWNWSQLWGNWNRKNASAFKG